jgi:hypothetical protein
MSTLAEIEIAAAGLAPADKLALLEWLQAEMSVIGDTTGPERLRTPGLGAGAWQVADDFDAPLPDSFWLGRDL